MRVYLEKLNFFTAVLASLVIARRGKWWVQRSATLFRFKPSGTSGQIFAVQKDCLINLDTLRIFHTDKMHGISVCG